MFLLILFQNIKNERMCVKVDNHILSSYKSCDSVKIIYRK